MEKNTKISFDKIIFLLLIFSTQLHSFAGKTALSFLKLSVSTKHTSMGETAVAIGDDINSLHYNPACLGFIRDKQFLFTHLEYIAGIRYNIASFGLYNKYGNFGISVGYLYVHDIPKVIIKGPDLPEILPERFSVYDFLLLLSHSRLINENAIIGLNIKFARETLEAYSAHSFLLDIGFLHTIKELSIGLSVQNLGTAVRFIREYSPTPLLMKLGVGYKSKKFKLGCDVVQPIDTDLQLHFGGEILLLDFLFLRAGYKLRGFQQHKLGYLSGLTAGFGLQLANYGFDFAFVPYGELGNSFHFSFIGRY